MLGLGNNSKGYDQSASKLAGRRQIASFLLKLTKFYVCGLLVVSIFFLFSQLMTPQPVFAQNNNRANVGVAGFNGCNFDGTVDPNSNMLHTCLKQIFTFAFVVAVFLIAFRIGIAAIEDYNPVVNGNAVSDTVSLVRDVTIGLILIGGPVLILNTLNPATLNFNLNLGNLVGPTTSTDVNNNNRNNNPGSGGTSNSAIGSGVRPKNVRDAVNTLESKSISLNYNPNLAWGVKVWASTMRTQEAEKIITDVLTVEVKCKNLFVDQFTVNDCKTIEQEDWITARQAISDKTRKELTPLFDSKVSFISQNFATKNLKILDTKIQPSSLIKTDCKMAYAQVQTEEDKPKIYTIGGEICGNRPVTMAFFKGNGDQVQPKEGESITQYTQVSGSNDLFHIIS
jgi:hypothetical protein